MDYASPMNWVVMLTMLRDCKSSRVQNAYCPLFPRLLPALKCELYIAIKEPWDVKVTKKYWPSSCCTEPENKVHFEVETKSKHLHNILGSESSG